jgi:RNA polymerase sigma-70 factor (ECF subfamily)
MEAEMTRHRDAPPTPEHDLAATQARGFIERAVHSLPDGFREVFILRAVEGMSVQETADCLDLEPTTVRTRFFRARAQMRKRLDGEVLSLVGALYPFAGQSCDRVVERVLRRLNEQHKNVVLN